MAKRQSHQTNNTRTDMRSTTSMRFGGLLALFLLLCAAALWTNTTVWAAPRGSAQYQTVPKPTEEATNTPVPTATPRKNPTATPRRDDNNNPSPTATPAPTKASTESALTGAVSVVVLNVRQGPGTAFDVIGTVTQSAVVEILERNQDGSWWRMCCIANTEQTGWVSAQFVTPDFEASRANELIPLAGEIPAAPAAPTLKLEIQMQPAFVWPGQAFVLNFAMTNLSSSSVQNVSFGDELAQTLELVRVTASAEGSASSSTVDNGDTLVEVTWAEVAAGATVNAAVTLRVADSVATGDVIDNLAAVGADGIDDITAGISIGMPPTTLPDFK